MFTKSQKASLKRGLKIAKAVNDAFEVFGDRPACIAREISKLHEEFVRGNLSELKTICSERKLKGEIVLIVAGLKYSEKISKLDQ